MWLKEQLARAARWLTSRDPADCAVWLFVGLVSLVIAVPWLLRARDNARQTQTGENLRQVGTALWSYSELHRSLPSTGRLQHIPRLGDGSGESHDSPGASPVPETP